MYLKKLLHNWAQRYEFITNIHHEGVTIFKIVTPNCHIFVFLQHHLHFCNTSSRINIGKIVRVVEKNAYLCSHKEQSKHKK